MRKHIIKNKIIISFLLSLILGMIIIVPNMIAGKGIFSLVADFDMQQIPFNMMINNSIKEGSILWTWYNELGSNFIGTFSFYNLFSPFNIIGYLFPASWFPYLIGPIFILKYGIAGLTSYLFLKRYVKNKNYAIIGSLLYTFSGFQLTNTLFYHFHDVVAFFPLLLYTLDNLVYDNKNVWFSLSVALAAFTNWFFFIGEVVFIIMYYIIKIIAKDYKFNIKLLFTVLFEGLIGTLLAAVVLIPSFLFTISNPRISDSWNLINMFKYWDLGVYFEIVRSFIFPSEIMNPRAFLTEGNYSSVELYLPFVGVVLASSCVFKKPKNWESILMITCVIFMIVPILNSSFFAFKINYYARWFYMPILIMSLLSIKALEEKLKIKSGLLLTLIILVITSIICALYIFVNGPDKKIIYDSSYMVVAITLMLINLVGVCFLLKIKKENIKILLCILAIIIYVSIWGNYTIYKYKNNTFNTSLQYKFYLESSKYIKFNKITRTNSSNSCNFNYGYILRNGNIKNFNTNLNGSNFEFYGSIDYQRVVSTVISPEDKKLNNFLSIEYIIDCGDENLAHYGYVLKEKGDGYNIYYNPEHDNMGFTREKYMLDKDFNKLSPEDKREALSTTVILNKEQVCKYKKIFDTKPKYNSNEYYYINNGFKSKINSTEETLAIYTIPYDDGWTAFINGKETFIEKVDNGFMAVKIDKGLNDIKFKYFPPGLKIGIIISVCSLLTLIVYIYNAKKA